MSASAQKGQIKADLQCLATDLERIAEGVVRVYGDDATRLTLAAALLLCSSIVAEAVRSLEESQS